MSHGRLPISIRESGTGAGTGTWLVIVYSEVLELQGSAQMFFQDVLSLMCLEPNPEVFQQW